MHTSSIDMQNMLKPLTHEGNLRGNPDVRMHGLVGETMARKYSLLNITSGGEELGFDFPTPHVIVSKDWEHF